MNVINVTAQEAEDQANNLKLGRAAVLGKLKQEYEENIKHHDQIYLEAIAAAQAKTQNRTCWRPRRSCQETAWAW